MTLFTSPASPPTSICGHENCNEVFLTDLSHRFGVGIAHYKRDKSGQYVRSYNQVFRSFHCCTRAHALETAHVNADNLASLPFGSYDQLRHNPVGEQTDATCKLNVEYNLAGALPDSALPTIDAITGESLVGASDIYVPHVDDSTKGMMYQTVLQVAGHPITRWLGTATLENAVTLCHRILDEVLEAVHQGHKPFLQEVP